MLIKCKKCPMHDECICFSSSDECVVRIESFNKAIDDFIKFASDMPIIKKMEKKDLCD